MPHSEFVLSPPPGFSFLETLKAHGWRDLLPFAWHEESAELQRVERLPDGSVVLLKIRETDAGDLHVGVSETADEAEITGRISAMLQLDFPLESFHDYCRARPELAHIPIRQQGRMLCSPTLFEDCVKVICTTNTTWAQTRAMVARLCEHFGSPLPSDTSSHAFPTPEQIAAAPVDDFAAKAKMGYRNASVHQIATRIASGDLDLEAWRDRQIPAADLQKRLLSLPGVGPYSAACLMLYMGRPEHVNADSWARMLLSKELGRPVTDKEVHAYFDSYGEWRGLVYNFYNWAQP